MDMGNYTFVVVIPEHFQADLLAGKTAEIQLRTLLFEILNRAKTQPKTEPIRTAKKAMKSVVPNPRGINIHLPFAIITS